MRTIEVVALLCAVMLLPMVASAGIISPELQKLLDQGDPDRMYKVIAALAEQADIYALDDVLVSERATLAERNFRVITALQETATRTQPLVLNVLNSLGAEGKVTNIRPLWLANLIAFEAPGVAIKTLAEMPEIGTIAIDYPIELIEPIVEIKPAPSDNLLTTVETGLSAIRAPEAWALGYTGVGRVVSNLDTGVDGNHPALFSRFRGDVDGDGDYDESWYDPYDTHWSFPQDSGTHGTHTMGTICGRSPAGDTVGVAINALWIAAAPIDRGGGLERTISDALLSFQWIADPDGNPNTQDNPDACGNSWGIPDGYGYADCDQTFWTAIDNCEAAGTVVIFSAGNESSSGLRSPADRATTYFNCFAVGAIDGNDPSYPIAYFSALGPSECATGDLAIKPEVVAPGWNVRSSVPGGGYSTMSGTSMASPHVTGAVAVIRQANPNLDANTIKQILMETARDLPLSNPDGEDNTFGHGIIDLYQAVLLAQGYGNVEGHVTDANTSAPLPARVSVVGTEIGVNANSSGYYIIGLPSDTTFTLRASYFGYLPQDAAVQIIGDDTVTQNFPLAPAPAAVLQGTVTSVRGDSIGDAEVTILNTPITPETTDVNGFYQFPSVPSGSTYQIRVKALGYSQGLDSIFVQYGLINVVNFSLWPAETFEYNNGGYTGDGVWEWGVPTYGPPGAWSGTKVWGTVLAGVYPDYADDSLFSVSYYISGPSARLQFYHWYNIETSWDGGNVAISTNGGASWSVITPDGGYDDPNIDAFGNLEPGFTGSSSGWEPVSFDLSPYHGQNVQFRWRFGSDQSVTYAGWYIDDVVVVGSTPPEPPDMSYSPSSFNVDGTPGAIETRTLTLINDGNGPLVFTLLSEVFSPLADLTSALPVAPREPLGYRSSSDKAGAESEPYFPPVITSQGGPDAFGYRWIDSNEPGGPVYNWIDITSSGTLINWPGDEDDGVVTGIPIGFQFPFYGNVHTSLNICTNGFISFTSTVTAYTNTTIPNTADPNNLLAAYWDDLNFEPRGNAYYYTNNLDSFIVAFVGVPHYADDGLFTFEVILQRSGKITYQYQEASGIDVNQETIGIENASGTVGLQVAYNAPYVTSNLAVLFYAPTIWLSTSPVSGTIPPQDTVDVTVTFDATDLDVGVYTGNINLLNNDPTNPDVDIPALFNVGMGGTPDMSFTPTSIADTLSPFTEADHTIKIHNNGDGALAVTFTTEQAWIQFTAGPHYVPPLDSLNFVVTINADELSPGNYNGSLDYASNDPDNSSGTIPVSLLVLSPDISFSPTSITDSLGENSQASHSVVFSNSGQGILSVSFTANQTWIELDVIPSLINPGTSDTLELTLNSAGLAPGTHTGTIDFTSNDPDAPSGAIPVTLFIYAPNIVVDPPAIGDTLETDQQSTKYVFIDNTGPGVLDYSLTYQIFSPLAGRANPLPAFAALTQAPVGEFTILSGDSDKSRQRVDRTLIGPLNPPMILDQGGPDAFGYWWIDSNEPAGPTYSWRDISSIGVPITGLGDDTNVGPYSIGFNFNFYGNVFNSFRFCTNGFISFTSTSNAYDNTGLPSAAAPFDLIAPFWDDLTFVSAGQAYYYTNSSDSLVISWIDVPPYSPGGPYTFQIILLASGRIILQYQSINAPDDSATIGIQNNTGTMGLQVAYNQAYVTNNLAVEFRLGTWLAVSPTSGTIAPNDRDTLTVSFDAGGLAEGSYTGQIDIASNDPDSPNVTVPVNLEVSLEPTAIISLNVSSIQDTAFSGYTTGFMLLVSNVGSLDLNYDVTDNRTWISENPPSGTVQPSLIDTVTITFDATSLPPGTYTGTVTVNSNDLTQPQIDLPVTLSVVVPQIPDIAVLPATFDVSVPEGQLTVRDFTVANVGNGALTYSIIDNRNWLSENPASGQVAEGEPPDTIQVTFDATSLTQGTYTGTITVSSNDPDEATVDIAVTLHVIVAGACDYTPGDINSDGSVTGSDVTYGVNYLRGILVPPDSCQLSDGSWLYAAGDVNGSCSFIGSDITYLVNYLRGVNDSLLCCPEVPPAAPTSASPPGNIQSDKAAVDPLEKEATAFEQKARMK